MAPASHWFSAIFGELSLRHPKPFQFDHPGIYGLTLTGATAPSTRHSMTAVIEGALSCAWRLDTRYVNSQIASFGGVAARLPRTATFFVITMLAMAGLPMLNGFIGEFLILSSTFSEVGKGWAIAATADDHPRRGLFSLARAAAFLWA